MKTRSESMGPVNRPKEIKDQQQHSALGKPFVVIRKSALLRRIAQALTEPERQFELTTRIPVATGAYVLMHTENVSLYTDTDTRQGPLYVGCALDVNQRRTDHLRSLKGATLTVGGFKIVYLPTVDIASAAYLEQVMVQSYKPLWNQTRLSGFGSHAQGSTRQSGQAATAWDVLHPGRSWAAQAAETVVIDLNRLEQEDTENTQRQNAG